MHPRTRDPPGTGLTVLVNRRKKKKEGIGDRSIELAVLGGGPREVRGAGPLESAAEKNRRAEQKTERAGGVNWEQNPTQDRTSSPSPNL